MWSAWCPVKPAPNAIMAMQMGAPGKAWLRMTSSACATSHALAKST